MKKIQMKSSGTQTNTIEEPQQTKECEKKNQSETEKKS
jgi:hypothetical protein